MNASTTLGNAVGVESSLSRQCWLFATGSTLFAIASAPYFAVFAGSETTNLLSFLGSWFFTRAAWIQLKLSRSELEWYSAAVQFAGTVLFNISTGAAFWSSGPGSAGPWSSAPRSSAPWIWVPLLQSAEARRHLIWTPDAVGSLAFLVSGALAIIAVGAAAAARDRRIAWLNMAGCVAFAVSAVAGFIRRSGVTEDQWLANLGTFVGALCFAVAALAALPRFRDRGGALRQSAA